MSTNEKVWLIGAGPMAIDYAKVLKAQNVNFIVVGRGSNSAQAFTEQTGVPVVLGGLEAFLDAAPELPHSAIVSVGMEVLAETTQRLLVYGVQRILVEKPGAMTRHEIHELGALAREKAAEVLIAYNRRLYASTLRAQQIIEEDGGVKSIHYEFTEWDHLIRELKKADGIKPVWLLANSTHVIDLAFYLGGRPADWQAFTAGKLDWHPASSIFAGAGRTDRNVLFTYQANWGAPGRWGIEVLTDNYRLIFRPMESLQIMRKGSVVIEPLPLDERWDKAYKPGLYEQVRRFLSGDFQGICTLDEQVEMWDFYTKIAGYPVI
jgi:predicted dehydrogenase